MEQTLPSREEAISILWHRGVLRWKLHGIQNQMYETITDNTKEIIVITSSRRIGKSFFLCLFASEKCLQNPGFIVKYVCPQQNMVKEIIEPIMNQIFLDCPLHLRPTFKTNARKFLFPNGSQIQIAGTDKGSHESLRGGKSNLWIVDEAGFCNSLKYVVNSVLAPTADTTGGRGILASTPSPAPDHEFITEFVNPNELSGELIKYTIYDNPMMTPEKIKKIINRYPLKEEDPEFRREYLCEVIIDTERAVIPEFANEDIRKQCIKDWPKPAFYDRYVGMDIGFRDLTVVLFGYYDFKNAKIVIDDEYYISGTKVRADVIAKAVKERERKLYTNPITGDYTEPYLRIADDNNLILLNELIYDHDLNFVPTRKDNKEAAISNLRMKIFQNRLIINPKCRVLIHHLKSAIWDKNRTKYERVKAITLINPDGTTTHIPKNHYDAVDALIYMVRNIQENKNPYPAGYGMGNGPDLFVSPHYKPKEEQYQEFINMFKVKSSLKKKSKT